MAMSTISILQEFLQGCHKSPPYYTEIPLPDGTFQIRCTCMGLTADGEGSTKKMAKHRAAGSMIRLLREKKKVQIRALQEETASPLDNIITTEANPTCRALINHIGKLQEFCASKQIQQPEYRDINISGPNHKPEFTVECRIRDCTVRGSALTKKQAKQVAAGEMRNLLRTTGILDDRDMLLSSLNNSIGESEISAQDLTIDVNRLKVSEDPLLAIATQRATENYSKLHKRRVQIIDDAKNISIANYHEVFKNVFNAEVIEQFHVYYESLDMTAKHSKARVTEILQNICSILGTEYEERKLKVVSTTLYVAVYHLKTTPSYTSIGNGPQLEVAQVDALHRLIADIYVLLV